MLDWGLTSVSELGTMPVQSGELGVLGGESFELPLEVIGPQHFNVLNIRGSICNVLIGFQKSWDIVGS